ncbi:MAG: arsenate reductase family protein [Bacteroidia bacterium]
MKILFHLSSCSTCQRIIKTIQPGPEITLQDIKTEPITAEQLDVMHKLEGSYEALFSRRAMKYRAMGLHEQTLTEADYRRYILEEYTFLKRPVLVLDDQIFVGNTKKVVEAAANALAES